MASWGGLMAPPLLELPFRDSFWGDPESLIEEPLIIGNCRELGGSAPFLLISAVEARLRLFVKRGDMNVMGRPPGVVVSASWSKAFKSSSRLRSISAVWSALAPGVDCPSEVALSSFLTEVGGAARLRRGFGSLGEANTSLKLMLMGVSGAHPTPIPPGLPFAPLFEARGEIQIMPR